MRQAWLQAIVVALVLLVMSTTAARAGDDFLPVDDAFSASSERVDASHIAVTWRIADGYYLYRHAFAFTLKNAGGAKAGEARIPPGNRHNDEFFGPVETYRNRVRVVVPIEGAASTPADLRIAVGYQGCADAGLCYPPQRRSLDVAAAGGTAPGASSVANPVATPSKPAGNGGFVARQDALAQRLAGAGTLTTLALFFGLGVLLAFTPCILPMIPILSGLIVGSGATPRRALVLSLAYVLAMAAAYTVFGVVAGYFGANIQAAMQMPAVLFAFAAIFVLLALASFGLFDVQAPGRWRERFGAVGSRRGGVVGAALMGFFAALIAGPCLAPPLVGALLYISSSGDAVLGGAALFMLGLGMGVPLIAIATFGARFMPRAGSWMTQVRIFFGMLLLAVALWLVSRVLDSTPTLAAWGLLALAYGAYLSTRRPGHAIAQTCQRALVFLLFLYAGCAGVGVLAGHGRADRPLAGLSALSTKASADSSANPVFTRVRGLDQLKAALDAAARHGRPAMVDFYADWCVDCVQMEHTVFADDNVRKVLDDVTALQVDVTAYDSQDRALMRALNVFGPPTLLFYRADGNEAADQRLVGSIDTAGFIRHLRRAVGAGRDRS